jgi:hypothetical protein
MLTRLTKNSRVNEVATRRRKPMRFTKLFLVFLFVTPAWCGTKLPLHDVTSPVVRVSVYHSNPGPGFDYVCCEQRSGPDDRRAAQEKC